MEIPPHPAMTPSSTLPLVAGVPAKAVIRGAAKSSSGGYAFNKTLTQPVSREEALRGIREPTGDFNTATYDHIGENPFLEAKGNPLSTFSIDVDTASYSNIRRFVNEGSLPPKDAVRVEEMINYFAFDYPQPGDGRPFAVHLDVTSCPWETSHRLVRIGLKGIEIATDKRGSEQSGFPSRCFGFDDATAATPSGETGDANAG